VQQENNSPVLTVEAIVRQLFFFFQIFPFTGHGERVQCPWWFCSKSQKFKKVSRHLGLGQVRLSAGVGWWGLYSPRPANVLQEECAVPLALQIFRNFCNFWCALPILE